MNVVELRDIMVEVYEFADIESPEEWTPQVEQWSNGLWWSDFEEAGVSKCFFAFDEDEVIGFQTVNGDGLTVAIEVREDWQGNGIARLLVGESGSYRPEANENPGFWEAMEAVYA